MRPNAECTGIRLDIQPCDKRGCPKKRTAVHKVIGHVCLKQWNGQSHTVIHVGRQKEENHCPSSWVTGV